MVLLCGLFHRHSFRMFLGGKLDDQHRIFAQQSDQHHKPYLRIDVIGQAHQLQHSERNEHTHRQ